MDGRPNSCAQAINQCSAQAYPNITKLLQIICTIPVTSCECETSASVLRRLNNFMRATMTNQYFTGLTLMHCNYDFAIDLDQVVSLFARLHPRKMELDTAL